MKEREIIGAELAPDENLLWSGMPRQGFFLRASDWLIVPFSLVWFGIMFYIVSFVWTGDASSEAKFSMTGFVLGGLYLVFGRFVIDIWRRGKTFYGVTDERIIFVFNGFNRKIESINFDELVNVTLNKRADGAGTIVFNDPIQSISDKDYVAGRMNRPKPPQFEQIPNVQTVFDMIEAQRQTSN